MNFSGLIIAVTTFLVIGVFHPIVIKAEYHLGTRCWWAFLLAGIAFIVALVLSSSVAVTAQTLVGEYDESTEYFDSKKYNKWRKLHDKSKW